MTEQAKKSKKRTSFLTMLVIAILIALVGVQLIHLRSQIDDARSQLTALQSDLDAAKQENDALSSALEKADDPEFIYRSFEIFVHLCYDIEKETEEPFALSFLPHQRKEPTL